MEDWIASVGPHTPFHFISIDLYLFGQIRFVEEVAAHLRVCYSYLVGRIWTDDIEVLSSRVLSIRIGDNRR